MNDLMGIVFLIHNLRAVLSFTIEILFFYLNSM